MKEEMSKSEKKMKVSFNLILMTLSQLHFFIVLTFEMQRIQNKVKKGTRDLMQYVQVEWEMSHKQLKDLMEN